MKQEGTRTIRGWIWLALIGLTAGIVHGYMAVSSHAPKLAAGRIAEASTGEELQTPQLPRTVNIGDWTYFNITAQVSRTNNGYLRIVETIPRGDEHRDRSNERNYRVYLHPTQGWRLGCTVDGKFRDLMRIATIEYDGAGVLPDEVRVVDANGNLLYQTQLQRVPHDIVP